MRSPTSSSPPSRMGLGYCRQKQSTATCQNIWSSQNTASWLFSSENSYLSWTTPFSIVISLFMKCCENSVLHYTLLSRLFHGKATGHPKVAVWPNLHRVVAHVAT